MGRHDAPASSDRKVPADEIAAKIRSWLLGSMTIVWRHIPPAPGAHSAAVLWVRKPGSSLQVLPPSGDSNRAASSTPAYTFSGSLREGSRCHTRLNSHGCGEPSYHLCVPVAPSERSWLPAASHALPPSSARWSTWPNQPLDCRASS